MDFIDYVNMTKLKLSVFKSMSELCGDMNDSVTFWHKFGRLGDKIMLVSTDVEAVIVLQKIFPNIEYSRCILNIWTHILK